MPLERPEERKAQRPREFQERHGYKPGEVPDIWIGQAVAVSVVGGRRDDRLLNVQDASGVLEAVRDDGFVVSSGGGRVVYYPREAVFHIELLDEQRRRPTPRSRPAEMPEDPAP